MADRIIPNFAHHCLPLLRPPAEAGAIGGKSHIAGVKAACKNVERIHGVIQLAGRFELAVLPGVPDFFDPAPGWAKVRSDVWEVMRESLRLYWVIPTRFPENINRLLPPSWTGKGYQNICIGLVADCGDGFAEKLEALRGAKVQRRMLLLRAASKGLDLVSDLRGIDWVILAGTSADTSAAAAIGEVCRQANVAFLFHQTDTPQTGTRHTGAVGEAGETPVFESHPFGSRINLSQPTLADLMPLSDAVIALPELDSVTMMERIAIHVDLGTEPTHPPDLVQEPFVPPAVNVSEPSVADCIVDEVIATTATDDDEVLADFRRLDAVVRKGLETFIEVGHALAEIRDRELWRAGDHPSWAAYCLAVGGLTKIHANRLIKGSEVASKITEVKPVGFTCPDVTPRAEWQIRPLHRLPDAEQQGIAWRRAVERANGQPTARQISDVVAELMAEDAPAPSPKFDRKALLTDMIQRLRSAINGWEYAAEVEGIISELVSMLRLK